MGCRICLGRMRRDVFRTGRVAMCKTCITLLNNTEITPQRAESILRDRHREDMRRWVVDVVTQGGRADWHPALALRLLEDEGFFEWKHQQWFPARLAEYLSGKRSLSRDPLIAAKVLRAKHHRLLRADPQRSVDYPKNWALRGARIRARDGEKCKLCGKTWQPGVIDLHVHHIIHKSNGGSHSQNNLVTLCHPCHNKQHPEQCFTPAARTPETMQPLPSPESPTFGSTMHEFRNQNAGQMVLFSRPEPESNIPPTPPHKANPMNPTLRIVLIFAGIAVLLAALRMVGCSPGQVVARASGMTIEECTAKYRVHAAGTQRAVNVGFSACRSLIEGTPGPWGADSKCVLRGIADVKTEQGLGLLGRQCRD